MAKRYVFWRSPAGTPCRESGDKFAPRHLLEQIGRTASINKDGKPQWHGFELLELEAAVRATVTIIDGSKRELNRRDTWSIVRRAIGSIIREKGGKCSINPEDVIELSNIEASKHYRRKHRTYTLVTSLSIDEFPAKQITIRNCVIAPIMDRRRRYVVPDDVAIMFGNTRYRAHLESTEYQHVRVRTSGRTVNEGADNAFEALNLLRGYWNLVATFGSWSMSFGARNAKSLGVVHTGPIHTLHHNDGSIVDRMYWYETGYVEDVKLFSPKNGWEGIERDRKWAMRKVHRLVYRNELENLIALYTIALDQSDMDLALVQMWSILETLTHTVGGRYDDTVKRASWIFQNHVLKKEQLSSLRVLRNRYVHAARSDTGREQIAYMIKSFIDPHLIHLIRNDFKVASLNEYGSHLALPKDIKILNLRRRRLGVACSILEALEPPKAAK